jgi:hypothetical protein
MRRVGPEAFLVAAATAMGVALVFPPFAQAVEKVACVDAHARSQEFRQTNKLRHSRAQLLICADASCPVLVRADCVDWLSQIEQRVPSLAIDARDAADHRLTAVRVIVDGETVLDNLTQPVVRLDAGQHQFRFEHEGSPPIAMNVALREGEPGRTLLIQFGAPPGVNDAHHNSTVPPRMPVITPTPAPTPTSHSTQSRHPRAPIVTGAVAALSLGSMAYFGIRGLQAASRLKEQCGSSCSPDSVAPVRTQLLVADISMATAVIMGGITAWFILDNRQAGEAGSMGPSVSASVGADSIGLRYGGRF